MYMTLTTGACGHCQRRGNRTLWLRWDLRSFRMDEPSLHISQEQRDQCSAWICPECLYTATHLAA